MNILDLLKEQPPTMQQPEPVVPTEKAQLVIIYTNLQEHLIVRYNSRKRAEAALDRLFKSWKQWKDGTGDPLYVLPADMFDAYVDLSCIASICHVDHAKRGRFIPV